MAGEGREEVRVGPVQPFQQAEGGGLRDLLARAVAHEIPTLVGVPRRNMESWRRFAEGFSDICDVKEAGYLSAWVNKRIGSRFALS